MSHDQRMGSLQDLVSFIIRPFWLYTSIYTSVQVGWFNHMQRNGAPADGRNKWVSLGFRHTLYNWSYGYLWTGRGRSCGCERKTKICLSQNIINPVQKNINVLKYLQKVSTVSRKIDTPIRAKLCVYIYIYLLYVCTTFIPGLYQGKETYKKIEWLEVGSAVPIFTTQPQDSTASKAAYDDWSSCPPNRPPSEIKVNPLLRRGAVRCVCVCYFFSGGGVVGWLAIHHARGHKQKPPCVNSKQ